MDKRERFVHGSFNAICQRCGLKFKKEELKQEWTGLRVCFPCWEPRHPLDYIKPNTRESKVPWTRKPNDTVFTTVPYTDLYIDTGYFEGDILDPYFEDQ